MKTTYILCRDYKKLPLAENILGDFSYVQLFYCSIVLLAAQATARHGVVGLFVSFLCLSSVIIVDKKCADLTQRSESCDC